MVMSQLYLLECSDRVQRDTSITCNFMAATSSSSSSTNFIMTQVLNKASGLLCVMYYANVTCNFMAATFSFVMKKSKI